MGTYIIDVIEGRKGGILIKGALNTMSHLFAAAVALRNFAFDKKWIKEKRVSIPVISIGNIIAGGAGKTPFIQKLATDLGNSGRVSILLRGYRSDVEKHNENLHLMDPVHTTPKICGDEAALLFKKLPNAQIFVGKDRVLNAKRAIHKNANVLLLDDGMQYRTLYRDIEITILHGDNLYGKGFFLPRGYLRDSPKRLQNSHAIVVNHVRSWDHFHAIKKEVSTWTSAPVIGTRMYPKKIELLQKRYWKNLKNKRVAIFCGLGQPHSFFSTVAELGGEIVDKWVLPDHATPKKSEIQAFAKKCALNRCDLILCSEKDWLKLPLDQHFPTPIGCLHAKLMVCAGQGEYNTLLEQIRTLMKKR